jgi:hypothetical protein
MPNRHNLDKSNDIFFRQVAARVSDMFCNFYKLKNHKIDVTLTTTEAREKVRTCLEPLEFKNYIDI